ncbi:MAG: Uncharacterised protein [Gammaproteobacteria bacterium]|nr:MAG: Uncharacterised protein [Gammaproteobacteria bacterium]
MIGGDSVFSARVLLTFACVIASPIVQAAWGVNERSVAKWSDEKLCQARGKFEARNDSGAFEVVVAEINKRSSIDKAACTASSEKTFSKYGESVRRRKTDQVEGPDARLIKKAKIATYEKFGASLFQSSYSLSCNGIESEFSLSDVVNFSALKYGELFRVSRRTRDFTFLVTNGVRSEFSGARVAASAIFFNNPSVCANTTDEQIDVMTNNFVALMSGATRTAQNVELQVEIGDKRSELLEKLGEPILSEQLGPILEEHYCSTGEFGTYLALYYFNDALLAYSRYQSQSAIDCKNSPKTGTYKLPPAIEALLKN